MQLNPVYAAVGTIFKNDPMFFIPKYQRAYAWDSDAVNDFIKDLKNCFTFRKNDSESSHFFGGILSVSYPVQGVVDQNEYEVIDGQQRLSTFTLLMASVVNIYEELKSELQGNGDATEIPIIQKRIDKLKSRFIAFEQEVQRESKTVDVLQLSKADSDFYKDLIRGLKPQPLRDSHKRLLNAYLSIYEAVSSMAKQDSHSVVDKMDNLEIIQYVVDSDFTVLHMITQTRDDAFRLFQVINDRGQNLTEGDLLRAKSLELLEGFPEIQNRVEDLWIQILSDNPNDTKKYLNWIYEVSQGKRANQKNLFDNFLEAFFPHCKKSDITSQDAEEIYSTIKIIVEQTSKLRRLVEGQWLYEEKQPILGWDRNRLTLLIREIKHDLCIPLLLAASELDHKIFSDIVQTLEKAYFRYKIICNQHANSLQKIYRGEISRIKSQMELYSTDGLKQKLRELIDQKASDEIFENNLRNLRYKGSGEGSNKPLKYLLITIDYYYHAVLSEGILDKARVYDFASTTIEHIYPRNSDRSSDVYEATLEPRRNSLGNLTILDPSQNGTGENESFSEKKPIYESSSSAIQRFLVY